LSPSDEVAGALPEIRLIGAHAAINATATRTAGIAERETAVLQESEGERPELDPQGRNCLFDPKEWERRILMISFIEVPGRKMFATK
jgi:hypothetical protein